ncbi:MAG: acylphosphatase [Chthoniobacterales bacterium]|nr:acylphosphatase [Chthoniobacterales bacterium]
MDAANAHRPRGFVGRLRERGENWRTAFRHNRQLVCSQCDPDAVLSFRSAAGQRSRSAIAQRRDHESHPAFVWLCKSAIANRREWLRRERRYPARLVLPGRGETGPTTASAFAPDRIFGCESRGAIPDRFERSSPGRAAGTAAGADRDSAASLGKATVRARPARLDSYTGGVIVRRLPLPPRVITSLQIFFEGNVQGVGFRWSVKRVAKGFDVTGWVRNLADGRVELQVSGDEAEVRAFVEAIGQSELRAHIRKQQESALANAPSARGFEIRHD